VSVATSIVSKTHFASTLRTSPRCCSMPSWQFDGEKTRSERRSPRPMRSRCSRQEHASSPSIIRRSGVSPHRGIEARTSNDSAGTSPLRRRAFRSTNEPSPATSGSTEVGGSGFVAKPGFAGVRSAGDRLDAELVRPRQPGRRTANTPRRLEEESEAPNPEPNSHRSTASQPLRASSSWCRSVARRRRPSVRRLIAQVRPTPTRGAPG